MSEKHWTTQQAQAIQSRGGTLLVSAAAGSGKTAVLVERVVSMLLDEAHPVDADRLLVVTFSNAAAREMRQRIDGRLAQEQAENPHSQHLRHQRVLMERAHISTIHAFCLDLISQHTEELALPADFSLGDESRLALLQQEAAAQAVEAFYAADQNGSFSALVELLSGGRDDNRVTDTIFKLYGFIRSHPFYEDWLERKKEMYDPHMPVSETVWGRTILSYGIDAVEYCLQINRRLLEEMDGIPELEKAYGGPFREDGQRLSVLLAALQSSDWDDSCGQLRGFSFGRLGALRGFEDEGLKNALQLGRDQIKKTVKGLAQKQFCANSREFQEDIENLQPEVSTLFDLTLAYDRQYSRLKSEQKLLDFSDLEHLALRLLMEKSGGGYLPTVLAQQLSQEYEEVLVDEYQDTNTAQDMLFSAISRQDGNLFMVGDVKQSIYRFRQAMPEIFISKMNDYQTFDGENYPAKLILGKNFRSRPEVTGFVNFVFQQLMSWEMGEMDYGPEEELIPAAAYPSEEGMEPELHLIDTGDSQLPAAQLEAAYVAEKIAQLMTSGASVWENGAPRPLRFGDICVLLRSPKNKSQLYRDAFLQEGVNSWAESRNGFLQAREIRVITAFLQVLDNPYRDIPLLTVLMSDLFAFSPEQVAKIRLLDRRGAFYTALLCSAREGDEPSAAFLQQTQALRQLAVSMPVADLLTELYARTNYPATVSAYPMGEMRKANLHQLCSYAAAFEKSGGRGLYAFVRFLDRLAEQKTDFEPASAGGSADSVRIMSIHRSKGLEFPYIFLCDGAKAFNKQDLRERVALHPQMGFACVRRDAALLKEFTTVPLEALRLENERAGLSEELRVLYVAMTRAKEKLFITMAGDPGKMLRKAALAADGPLQPFVVRGADSMGIWLLMCALRHPDGQALREKSGMAISWRAPAKVPLKVCFGVPAKMQEGESSPDLEWITLPDKGLLEALRQNLNWRYPYEAATHIPQKLGVSAVTKKETASQYAFTKAPQFLTGEKLTGAQRGDALHHFMQYADYARCAENPEGELDRLLRMEFLTSAQAQVVPLERIRRFFSSSLYRRMTLAKRLERELRFLWEIDSRLMGYEDAASDKITVQGVADCVFWEEDGLVIVDYKTDAVSAAQQLAERYREQLRLYRLILGESLQTPVKSCIIYSFHLGQEIPLEF
ncbi:MAG: helicase-exonuclease AddAB subunit AddA [Oscillospiraceae bacterium]|nr:helicase-exonuclease AddAB subunit AddA [Oscillospiraceae bacterium]